MKTTTLRLCFGLAIIGTFGTAASAFAESRQSFAAEQRLLTQALSDLRAAKTKLHRIEREFGGHKSRAEQSLEETISAVESAIEHGKNNPESPPRHDR